MRMNFNDPQSALHPAVKEVEEEHQQTGNPQKNDEGDGAIRRVATELTGDAKAAFINQLIGGPAGRTQSPAWANPEVSAPKGK